MEREVDVVIVGGGLSGLRLGMMMMMMMNEKGNEKEKSFVVLEGDKERVGGRLRGEKDEKSVGIVWDVGGQWVGPQQVLVNKLLREMGFATVRQYDEGKMVFVDADGKRKVYNLNEPDSIGVYPREFASVIGKINGLAEKLPRENPWNSPLGKELDSMSVEEWVQKQFKGDNHGKKISSSFTGLRGLAASEEREVSMLFWTMFIQRACDADGGVGNITNLSLSIGGAQQDKILGSASSLPQAIYQRYLLDKVRLDSRVSLIERNVESKTLTVTTVNNDKYRAKHVVLAIPTCSMTRIKFEPAIPMRMRLAQAAPMASVIKTLILYKKTFWRSDGLSGLGLHYDGKCVHLTYDASGHKKKDDGSKDEFEQPALVAFLFGPTARYWSTQPKEKRKAAVLSDLEFIFQNSDARDYLEYMEYDWCQDEVGGGYFSIIPPGVLSYYGDSLESTIDGNLHFCGTETAKKWYGYMEGALESAERVYKEINTTINSSNNLKSKL